MMSLIMVLFDSSLDSYTPQIHQDSDSWVHRDIHTLTRISSLTRRFPVRLPLLPPGHSPNHAAGPAVRVRHRTAVTHNSLYYRGTYRPGAALRLPDRPAAAAGVS
jgi:hypothetical protein